MHRVPGVLQKVGRGLLAKEIAAGFHSRSLALPSSRQRSLQHSLEPARVEGPQDVGAFVLAGRRSDLYADCVGIDVEPVDDHHAASARFAF